MILPKEKLVCNLELARQLRDKGFPQDTYFWWVRPTNHVGNWMLCFRRVRGTFKTVDGEGVDYESDYCEYIAAPTSSEIEEFLDWDVVRLGLQYREPDYSKRIIRDTPRISNADFSALILLYRIDQGLVKFKERVK